MTRRTFAAFVLPAASRGAMNLDSVLREGVRRRGIPAVAAAVADSRKLLYSGGFGVRDSASKVGVSASSIFSIASMTKAITTAAALQLVERGKLSLDAPAGKYLPALARLDVLEGFDESGRPRLRHARTEVTLRRLLSHTSGFAYDTWNGERLRYSKVAASAAAPLMTDPGTRWEYGTSTDWTGRLVESVSGQNLEAYFQTHILQPLGMLDTSFIVSRAKFARKVSTWTRQPDGRLAEIPRKPPVPPTSYSGGGGLQSSVTSYIRFLQMILRQGKAVSGRPVLSRESAALMSTNQIGEMTAGKMKTFKPDVSADVDFHPGAEDRFTCGFLLNTEAYEKGRAAGSLAWAGLFNTFFWIDPKSDLCAVIAMQLLPFCDPEAMGMLRDFERGVYSRLS